MADNTKEIVAHMGEGIVLSKFKHRLKHGATADGGAWPSPRVERALAHRDAQAALDAVTKAGFRVVKNETP